MVFIMIKIPKIFHEILGEEQRKIDLLFIIVFAISSTVFLSLFYYNDISSLPIINQVILIILTIDITGGVVANLSFGTDNYYMNRRKARYVFIAIHIQVILIFVFAHLPLRIGLILWGYTMLCAIILELYKNNPSQKVLAGFMFSIGLLIVFGFQNMLTTFVVILVLFYLFKLLYSFSVNHHQESNDAKTIS